jgi:hypothetical protein
MTTIFRQMYRAQARLGQAAMCVERLRTLAVTIRDRVDSGRLLTCSVFHWGETFLFYYEAIRESCDPADLFSGVYDLFLPWPGDVHERFLVPLTDIFHCVEPLDLNHWRRKQPPERIHAQVARLRPEMVGSYIFYHYQLQEEVPGSFDKYCLIGIHEDLLFFYLEHPFVVEPPPAPGKLATRNSPKNWQEVMNPHFVYWEDTSSEERIWREIDAVFIISASALSTEP